MRYDLRPGRPDLARFPRADWLRSLSAAVRGAGDAELDYPPAEGSLLLRTVLAAYRGRVRGTLATAESVLICAGAAQAFITVADALAPARLAVEDPGHAEIRALLRARGLEPVPVPVDAEGIVVDALPGRCACRARHARAPVPDGRRAQPRAAGRAAALGRGARMRSSSRTTTTPSIATTARPSARSRVCGRTS